MQNSKTYVFVAWRDFNQNFACRESTDLSAPAHVFKFLQPQHCGDLKWAAVEI